MQPCILVIVDDPGFRSRIKEFLGQSGFAVRTGTGLSDVARHLSAGQVNLIVLGPQLGRENDLDLLRQVRFRSDVPVIIASHGRDVVDRVVALELGADDYLTDPFSPQELAARARAILRRAGAAGQRAAAAEPCRFAGWHLDRRSRRLTDPGGMVVALTKGEYALLLAFLDAPGRPLTREHLLHATRLREDVFDRSVDVQVLRLRRKLAQEPGRPSLIKTQRGVGYVFLPRVEQASEPVNRLCEDPPLPRSVQCWTERCMETEEALLAGVP